MDNAAGGSEARTFLVVEDNRKVRESLGDLLRLWGFSVVEASNGFQALRTLERGLLPAAILLDLELPLMSGWNLHVTLRGNPEFSGIPVVLVTAHELEGSRVPGIHAILGKPVRADVLLKTIQGCMNSAKTS